MHAAAIGALENQIKHLENEIKHLEKTQKLLLSSRSWKITAPLRAISALVPTRRR
jgi:hypothetical protein